MQVKDRQTNRRSIGATALICFLCQFMIAPNIALGNGHPNFAFVFATVIALSIGGRTGVACGFVSGLLYDLTATSPLGLMALLLTCSSFMLGLEAHDRIAEDPLTTVVPVTAAALVVSLAYHLAMLVVGLESGFVDIIFLRTLPTTLLTILAYLPFAFGIRRRHGGSGPALGAHARSNSGSRYSLPTR